jgi:hypothetical protein
MTWGGIDQQLSELAETPGVSEYQQNTRMVVTGELQRRPGMAPANFSPTGGSALGMVGAFPTSGPYGCVVDATGSISGFPITGPIWEPPKLKPPVPQGSQWAFGYYPWGGSFTDEVTGTCPGSITVSPGVGLTVTITRKRDVPYLEYLIDTRVTDGLDYTVQVPWDIVCTKITISHSAGGGSAVGAATPGCG